MVLPTVEVLQPCCTAQEKLWKCLTSQSRMVPFFLCCRFLHCYGVSLGLCLWVRSCWPGDVCPSHLLPRTGGLCLPQCLTALGHLQQWPEVQPEPWNGREQPEGMLWVWVGTFGPYFGGTALPCCLVVLSCEELD